MKIRAVKGIKKRERFGVMNSVYTKFEFIRTKFVFGKNKICKMPNSLENKKQNLDTELYFTAFVGEALINAKTKSTSMIRTQVKNMILFKL